MKEKLPISIVIPTKNEEENLTNLLTDIKNQTHLPSEIIVADAKSEDKTVQVAKKLGAKVVEGGKQSFGRNNGAKESKEGVIFFIDADVRLLEKTSLFDMYSEFIKKELDCGAPLFAPKDKHVSRKEKWDIRLINSVKIASTKTVLLKAEWSTLIVVKKKIFNKVGGFDEKLDYMEDTYLVRKIVRAKGKYDLINHKIGVTLVNPSKKQQGRDTADFKETIGAILGVMSLFFVRFRRTEKLAYELNKKAKKMYGPMGGIVKMDKPIMDSENPYKPKDRTSGYPREVSYRKRRFFEWIPGLFTWILLLLPVIFAVLRWEKLFVIYIAYLVAYWSVRTAKFVYGIIVGNMRRKRDLSTDWMSEIQKENPEGFKKLRFVYLCPVVSESLDTLEPSFRAFAQSDVGAEKIDVVVAMEEAKADLQKKNFEKLKKKFGDKFGSMQYYVHPKGIPGEVAGVKGGNINWAMRHYVEDLQEKGKDIHDYLLITCDSDLRPHPKYISAVAYKYLTVENPDMTYYASAVHTFNNNIWRVPSLIRTQSNMLSLVLMQNWVLDKKKRIPFLGEEVFVRDSFSSYAVNLKTLHDFEYWDPEIANDDTAFYWNAMVRSKGKFQSEEVYIPTYNDAVENQTYYKSHVSFYKQQHRWGWGVVNVPITLASITMDKSFPLSKMLFILKMIFETQIWYLTIVFVLTFGMNIMSWINPSFQFSAYSYNLSRLLSYVFTVITFSNIPIVILRRKLTPVPKNWKWWRHLLDFLETFLITINMLTFSFLPFLQAQTEMMLGLSKFKKNFYVTEKVKIKK